MTGSRRAAERAVFLDRDGTLVREVDFLLRLSQLRLLPGAAAAVRRLNEAGWLVILVTNQSGIARGLMTLEDFDGIQAELARRLAAQGAWFDAAYFCPHHPAGRVRRFRRRCPCRKPKAGMLRQAARDYNLDLGRCFFVGDRLLDLQTAARAGCRSLLVLTGYGRQEARRLRASRLEPVHIAPRLPQAVDWILGQEKSRRLRG
jgi:D-glycero-D-manno-heptose 1,7-bisphosphate phosphatase